MTRARILIASALLLTTALPGCNGLHTPTAAETGAKKVAQASAKARALAQRIAPSPDAVGKTLPVEGGEARELTQTLLAPAEAAKELRTLANEVSSAGGSDSQRREAKTLATRMRRDALMLDLMDLERIAQLKGAVASQIETRLGAIRSIEASGDLGAPKQAAARVKAIEQAKASYEGLVVAEQKRAEDARGALQPLDATVAGKTKDAEELDVEIQALRAQAATSSPSKALPLVTDAREKLGRAQDLRMEASEADRQADPLRATVRIVDTALAGDDDTAKFLDDRASEASKAAQGAAARAEAARKRATELGAECAELAKEFGRLQEELFEPAVKSVEENLAGGDLASKNPTDSAMIAMAKARFAAIRADAVEQMAILASGAGAGSAPAVEALRSDRAKFVDQAKAALLEARAALAGVEGATGAPMMAATEQLAMALGIDLATAAPAPTPAEDAAPSDAPATDAPAEAGDAPATDAPAGDAPAEEPAPVGEPAPEQPAGEPAPADPSDPNK